MSVRGLGHDDGNVGLDDGKMMGLERRYWIVETGMGNRSESAFVKVLAVGQMGKRKVCLHCFLVVLALSVLMGCSDGKFDRDRLPGTYVDQARGEFSVADDTLLLEHLGGLRYRIERRTGFHRLSDGKPGRREWEMEEWQLLWEEGTGELVEQRYGRRLRFDSEGGDLWIAARVYRRLED